MSHPVLVTGATGAQGGAVARELLQRGRAVRAMTRDTTKPAAKELAALGAEVVAGDFDDPAGLRAAATGAAAVFAMGTPFEVDPETETRQGIALLDAVHAAGVGHIVYTSVASALDGTGIPHFESKALVEQHLSTLDTPWTVIAPVAYLDNLVSPWTAPAIAQGTYAFPLPADVPLQQVAVADIAAFAALVVQEPERFAGKRVELASTEHTGTEVAAALSRWLGRPVAYAETGIDPDNEDFQRMVEFFRRGGYTVDLPALHAAYPEVRWHDLETWGATQTWS
ncbi:MAG: NmrA/HSCARG family protein [Hamadaea sp.]|nr:NmrA/HSCARG family protein [Hamadaea sp.]